MRALGQWLLERARAIGASGAARFAAPALSIAVLLAALAVLATLDWRAVLAMVPRRPLFWIVFGIAYFVPVVADWAIYRRIWGVPAAALVAFARKMVGNDLLVGYAGEAYLYAWARREGHPARAVFGAIKDVSILSAAVGSTATLLAAIAAAPFLGQALLGIPGWALVASAAVIVAPPTAALALRGKVFSLPPDALPAIAGLHALRATATIALTALLWHLALPGIALVWWLVFSALKLLASRLPFVSNKDLVFAGLAVVLLGRDAEVSALMTMMATLTLAMHAAVAVVTALGGAVEGTLAARARALA